MYAKTGAPARADAAAQRKASCEYAIHVCKHKFQTASRGGVHYLGTRRQLRAVICGISSLTWLKPGPKTPLAKVSTHAASFYLWITKVPASKSPHRRYQLFSVVQRNLRDHIGNGDISFSNKELPGLMFKFPAKMIVFKAQDHINEHCKTLHSLSLGVTGTTYNSHKLIHCTAMELKA